MGYKLSKYNVIADELDNKLIFNSLHNTFSVLKNEKYEKCLEAYINNAEEWTDLIKLGILVDENLDEENLANIKYMNTITSHDELRLIIMPTMQCIFCCKYCYENFEKGTMTLETENSIIKFVKKNINGYKSIRISWFGGEPSLCLETIKRINNACHEYARFYRVIFKSEMTTNGYLISLENFRSLIKCNVNMFQITIDGNEENHNFSRPLRGGKSTYNKIMSNLMNIKREVKSQMFTIMLRINFTQKMLNSFDEIVNEMKSKFDDDNRFVFLFREVEDLGGEQVKEISNNLIKNRNALTEKLLSYKNDIKLYGQFTQFNTLPLCYAAYNSSYIINPKGEVQKCTTALNDEFNNVGYINSDGIMVNNDKLSQWQGIIFESIKNNECRECSMYANCFGSVCSLNAIQYGSGRKDTCSNINLNLRAMYKYYNSIFRVVD